MAILSNNNYNSSQSANNIMMKQQISQTEQKQKEQIDKRMNDQIEKIREKAEREKAQVDRQTNRKQLILTQAKNNSSTNIAESLSIDDEIKLSKRKNEVLNKSVDLLETIENIEKDNLTEEELLGIKYSEYGELLREFNFKEYLNNILTEGVNENNVVDISILSGVSVNEMMNSKSGFYKAIRNINENVDIAKNQIENNEIKGYYKLSEILNTIK